ncbi:hypothetical protein HYPSUDRAFT_204465 [Hypholoma sublateritium FD-334 SS-4]|uniref:Uncharacterized protein n=1 Tax=Hypholoma sublateritium (strain FD-334 SS-4) TaxID=945553 RepID=A0A0D2NSG0_HYPSF|nr:hypothetical protein HYPSUDRAFT_204465 [Hypholoma sublateritium FD-334 SS-4]
MFHLHPHHTGPRPGIEAARPVLTLDRYVWNSSEQQLAMGGLATRSLCQLKLAAQAQVSLYRDEYEVSERLTAVPFVTGFVSAGFSAPLIGWSAQALLRLSYPNVSTDDRYAPRTLISNEHRTKVHPAAVSSLFCAALNIFVVVTVSLLSGRLFMGQAVLTVSALMLGFS